ncbi:hypothetical protein NJB93_20735 [Brucella intermedia]|uniref:hypothetical protein n=1 Tax=Brucella intermedia TaxID=94625 RepID=UPI00209B1870|nr:hypothetical protein [Brucella intermedia]MCO7728990.1 hypothetical protein [Brucella intermedia]
MSKEIFQVMEFHGTGDPFFGGNAADWCLYCQEDESLAFVAAHEAQRRELVKAYFPTEGEAQKAGAAASKRKGKVSALAVKPRPEVPTVQISWLVGNQHVGTDDAELAADFRSRIERAGAADPDLVAQIVAYALACHRDNQALFTACRF